MRPRPAAAPSPPGAGGAADLGRREMLGAAGALALLAALLLWPPLFGGRSTQSFTVGDPRIDVRPWVGLDAPRPSPLPRINPITPDIDFFVLPGVARVEQLRRQGVAPWWDDGQLLGYPLAANQPYPLFSPLASVTRWLDAVSALDWLLWLHTWVGGLLAYRAARMLGASPPAAAVAAVGFPLSTWMITRWHLPQIAHTSAWWPGLVCGLQWMRRDRCWRGALEIAAFGALAMVSGFPQVAAVMLLGTLVLAALDRPLRRLAAWGPLVLGVTTATLLAAPALVLSADAYVDSMRATPEARAGMASHGLSPGALAGSILPEFFGRPSDFAGPDPPAPTLRDNWPRRRLLEDDLQENPVENALYPGLLVLLLLPAAWRGSLAARPLLVVPAGAVAACMAWPALLALWPPAAALGAGNVKRLLVLVAGALPLAAALGAQSLLDGRDRVPRLWGPVVGLCIAGLAVWVAVAAPGGEERLQAAVRGEAVRQILLLVAGMAALVAAARARRGLLAWGAAALLALDLALRAHAFNPFPVQEPAFPPTPALAALAGRPGRVAVIGTDNVLPPTAAALHGIRSVHGIAPMVPRRVAELLACVEGPLVDAADPRIVHPFRDPASVGHPVLDLLGVRTIVHGRPDLLASLPLPLLHASGDEGLAWHDRPSGGPLAFVVGGAQVVPEAAERLARLAERDFDPHATALLERPPPGPLPEAGPMVPATLARPSALERRAAVEAPFDGVLVLAEAFDPGWSAAVDGAPAQLLPVDHALMGVALPPGRHEVVFVYAPPGLGRAGALRGAGLAALAVLAWLTLRRRAAPATDAP